MGQKKHTINIVFTLALLGIFAMSALFVAVLGAQVYGKTVDNMDSNYNTRNSLVYISEKIKQSPGRTISIDEVDGEQALVLSQKVNGKDYESWIFSNGGKLKEVMIPKGNKVKGMDGQEIMDITKFSVEVNDNLIKVSVFDKDGKEEYVVLSKSK